jgi:hypothetical protein
LRVKHIFSQKKKRRSNIVLLRIYNETADDYKH